ncbi:histidine phosphotransferase family protein [Paracoccus tegillarcae]|uniref:Histidine phosphotransferase n=1 Tax=Paracoccus tegillarcae TaxID=1529068 RepID=A0A2K9EH76_9RHOB|nr:histidine phosphotransferase family protein [Paracoccus tegillarcae]AUH34310.1 histidine phosphotransferase [Paracoccus tegillarcae]
MTVSATRIDDFDLALCLGSRLCHDLISPFGAIANGVELLQMGGQSAGPEMQLIADSVEAARARLQTFRMAFGQSRGDQRISGVEIAKLIEAMASQSRLTVEMDADGDQPRDEVQMLLLAIMCMESAMPWGGRVLVVRNGSQWRLVGEAERVKPEPELWSWLGGQGGDALQAPPPAKVHFALLAQAAAAANRPLTSDLDENGVEITF